MGKNNDDHYDSDCSGNCDCDDCECNKVKVEVT